MNKWNENVQNNRNFDRVLIRFGNEVNEILFPARGLLEGNNRRPCFRKDGNRLSRENLRYLHSYIRILAPLLRPPPFIVVVPNVLKNSASSAELHRKIKHPLE